MGPKMLTMFIREVINFPASMIGQQVYVAFVMRFTQTTTVISGDRWLLDNVRVSSACLSPTNLTATSVTDTSAQLSWTENNGATSWGIEIVPLASNPTGVGTVYNGSLPYAATGLTPGTAYKYYVRTLCASGGINSGWAGPFTFTTTGLTPLTTNCPTYVGSNAGNNAQGDLPTFVGCEAGVYAYGTNNSFFGAKSGSSSIGNYNSFFGNESGQNVEGSTNTFLGSHSGNDTKGSFNVFLGHASGS